MTSAPIPTPPPAPSILVVIVNYRTPELCAAALGAIAAEVRSGGDTHVVIVDNGSDDDSTVRIKAAIERLDAQSWCTLRALPDNRGFAAGNNAGIAACPGTDYIWLLNPDTIAEPGALTALVDFMHGHPDAAIAGGRCLWPDGTVRHSAFRFPSPIGELVSALDFGPLSRMLAHYVVAMPIGDEPFRADWLGGSHLMIRGTAYDRLGPMDEDYFLYFEEVDYCARAAAMGLERWHMPASRIVHIGGQATGITGRDRPTTRRPRYWFAARARFFLRHHGLWRTHLANLLWLTFYPAGSLLALLRGRPRHDPPLLWRDFLAHYYGPDGLMYRPAQVMR